MKRLLVALSVAAVMTGAAAAEVIAADASHYTLRHEAHSDLDPKALWARLIRPQDWWSSDHTYSGDAANLALTAKAGGLWQETWEGGSVEHGRVLAVQEGKQLRLDAPFGPLQGMGVTVIWTISIAADEDSGGSRVVFDEIANGSAASGLDKIAPAVDGVKSEAIQRLTASQ